MSFAGLIEARETFILCIAHLPMDGQSMIILDHPLNCWSESHEDKATDGEYTIRAGGWPCTSPSGESGSQDRQDVWDTDLRVGKREGGGEETLNFSTRLY